ncbi:MAG TPA: alanine racemase [Thermodesulfobacteriota bacterium]|nr:alanine racemase [Thermodesulfobacteriota bacterium]
MMKVTQRPTAAEIDLSALRFNLAQARSLAGPETEILAVVKADAYGHGAAEVAEELARAGVRIFGVATMEEGVALRRSGLTSSILVLGGAYPEEFDALVANRLTPVIFDLDNARALDRVAAASPRRIPVHLKADTGMNRLGIPWREWETALGVLASLRNLEIEGIMSHLSVAESETADDRSFTQEQARRFGACVEAARRKGLEPRYIHLANSAGTALHENARYNLVRVGLMLYGVHPAPALREKVTLRPMMRWKTAIVSVKSVPGGEGVSYGRAYCCRGESLIAVIPVGYADGYSRRLSNTGEALVRGMRAKIAGAICMDLTMIDVTDIPYVRKGDEVVLLGTQEGGEITAVELAARVGTIPYEVLCAVGKRVPRVYVGASKAAPR